MVLPLLFSMGLPALAGTGALGATLGAMSVPALAGIGAGLGSFIQTGDLGEGIQTGLTSFLGGKILGGLSGSTSQAALGTNAAVQGGAEAAKAGFLQAGPAATEVVILTNISYQSYITIMLLPLQHRKHFAIRLSGLRLVLS